MLVILIDGGTGIPKLAKICFASYSYKFKLFLLSLNNDEQCQVLALDHIREDLEQNFALRASVQTILLSAQYTNKIKNEHSKLLLACSFQESRRI